MLICLAGSHRRIGKAAEQISQHPFCGVERIIIEVIREQDRFGAAYVGESGGTASALSVRVGDNNVGCSRYVRWCCSSDRSSVDDIYISRGSAAELNGCSREKSCSAYGDGGSARVRTGTRRSRCHSRSRVGRSAIGEPSS